LRAFSEGRTFLLTGFHRRGQRFGGRLRGRSWAVNLLYAWHLFLLVLVERKSRFVLTRFIRHSTADAVATAIIDLLKNFVVHSITYDNGPPFAYYKRVETATGSSAYFCHPYHAWEKGTVENTIGLLREYHPKKNPISDCRHLHLSVRTKLNNRPRKTLEFRTAASYIGYLKKIA
jgi:IS30 family transposase